MNYSPKLVRLGAAANFFFALVSLLPPCLTAQFGSAPALEPLTSVTGYTCVTGYYRVANPGACNWDTTSRVTVTSVPAPFGLKDLQSHCAFATASVHPSLCGVAALHSFGSALYNEFGLLAGASMQVSPVTTVGFAAAYSRIGIALERPSHALRADIGASVDLSRTSRVSFVFHNIGQSGINGNSSTAMSDVAIAYGSELHTDIYAEIQYRVALQRARSLQCALRARIAQVLSLRIAADVASTLLGIEAAVDVTSSLRVMSTAHLHATLGARMGGGLSWAW